LAWRLRLAAQARADIREAVAWSRVSFGGMQAERYLIAIQATTEMLRQAPLGPRTRARDDLAPGLRVLHMRRAGQRGRHLLIFRVAEPDTVTVLRVLHDAMDPVRHLPPEGR
jgi:toxin ParE1/3/4